MLHSRGLAAYWPLENTALDGSGNGNNGTLIGSPSYAAGKLGRCIGLNGTTQFINCGNGASLQITGKTITMAAWIYPTAGGGRSIVAKWTDRSEGNAYGMRLIDYAGSTYLRALFGVAPLGADIAVIFTDLPIPIAAAWTHVAVVKTSTHILGYVNAVLSSITLSSTATIYNSSSDLRIGQLRPSPTYFFMGSIDEALIWNRDLTQPDIQRVMMGLTPIS